MSIGLTERKALGRCAKVGDLYDARSDSFTGNSLLKAHPPSTLFLSLDAFSFTEEQMVASDKFSEKAEKLRIDTQLKVSVLAGLVAVEGSGVYLQNEKESSKFVRCSLIHTIQTKTEQLDMFEELKDFCEFDSIDEKATHFVVKVCFGATTIVVMEYANNEKNNINDVKKDLQTHLKRLIAEALPGSSDHGKTAAFDIKKCTVYFFSDVIPHKMFPGSFEDALSLMKKLPEYLTASNSGKGCPLTFVLMPVSQLKDYLKLSALSHDSLSKQMDFEKVLAPFVKLFDDIAVAKQEMSNLQAEMEEHDQCVTEEELTLVTNAVNCFAANIARCKSNLATLLVNIRSGMTCVEQLELLESELRNCLRDISQVQKDCCKAVKRMGVADFFTKEGCTFIGLDSSSRILEQNISDLYVLHYSEECKLNDIICWNKNKTLFLNLLLSSKTEIPSNMSRSTQQQHKRLLFVVLDVDLRPDLIEQDTEKDIRIRLYRNGKCVETNVLQLNETQPLLCVARATDKTESVRELPEKLIKLTICCPGSTFGKCPAEDFIWLCEKCNTYLHYGLDAYFYCKCNGNRRLFAARFKFKCNNRNHGDEFMYFDKLLLWPLLAEIKPSNDILNILILGESGVGKSTWINSIANYTTFSSLNEATNSDPLSLIGSSFTVMGDNFEEKVIQIGDDTSESFKTGQSATQVPKSYLLNWKGTYIRLIDTPGVGDTRGIDQDKANFEAILKFLSAFKIVHGICILLKPNNARLTLMFQFCIKELLTRLNRSSTKNIVFCFTNTRNTFYKPGDTFPALKQLLQENKEVEIALSHDIVYCMDSESFRYLCMIHNNVTSAKSEMELYSMSWNKSASETNRLLEHIKSLKPHVVQDTITVNDTRRIIVNLTKPIASISQNIQSNGAVVEDNKRESKSLTNGIEELKKKLYMLTSDIVTVPLGYPRTVCTSIQCVKHHAVKNTALTKVEYVTHCHPQCLCVTGVRPECFPSPDLLRCIAMAGTQNCTVCRCPWSKHMHVTYDQVHKSVEVIDGSVENLINAKKNGIEKAELFIKELNAQQKTLQEEQAAIRKACEKFGNFLKNNAILTYNDALSEYLDIIIKQEKEKRHSVGDSNALELLETMRQEYLEESAILQMVIQNGNNFGCQSIAEIKRLLKTLYALPLKGTELKQQMEAAFTEEDRNIS